MQAGHSPLPIAAEDQRDQSGDQWGLQLNLKHPYPGSLWLILPQAPRHPTTRDSAWDKMRVQDEHHQVGPLPMQGSGNSFGLAPALTKPPQFSHCDLRVPTDFLLQLLPGKQVQHRLRYHTEQPSTHGCDLGGGGTGRVPHHHGGSEPRAATQGTRGRDHRTPKGIPGAHGYPGHGMQGGTAQLELVLETCFHSHQPHRYQECLPQQQGPLGAMLALEDSVTCSLLSSSRVLCTKRMNSLRSS